MPNRSRIAEALAGSPAAFDSQGLETPPEVTQAIMAMLMPPLATGARQVMAGAPGRLASEAGAVFPEGTAPEILPAITKGAKTGDPHALFAYEDSFGPGMTKRKLFNIFGDPSHPAIQKAGWGSSVTADTLAKYGIPITGKQL